MRLQKFLALQTVNSRRKAEELIASGIVSINGNVAQLGDVVDPEQDIVAVDGITVSSYVAAHPTSPIIIALNKPAGYVCSHAVRYKPHTIFQLLPSALLKHKLMFCGRLDKSTEGILLLTNDGQIAQHITHPSFGIKKHYEAMLSRPLSENIKKVLLKGITDDGEFLKFEKLIPIGKGNRKQQVFEIILTQGKKNEIHRVFEHFGIFVDALRRTKIGPVSVKGIGVGKYRQLSKEECERLLKPICE